MDKEGPLTLFDCRCYNSDTSGGVRTPLLSHLMCGYTCEHMSVHILQLATHGSKYSCKGEVGTVAAGGDDDSRGSESVVVMRRSL